MRRNDPQGAKWPASEGGRVRRRAALGPAFIGLLVAALPVQGSAQQHNILLIILDDVGVDMIGAYKPATGPAASVPFPATPTIDGLAEDGFRFTSVWSNPTCGPTRATIQTGRYSYRDNVVAAGATLPEETLGIADVLNTNSHLGFHQAVFGKWGLRERSTGEPEKVAIGHPIRFGFDYFAGKPDCCIHEGYRQYEKSTAKFSETCDSALPGHYQIDDCTICPAEQPGLCEPTPIPPGGYATSVNVDDMITWLDSLPAGQNWFATLSLNAAHIPFHAPPGESGSSEEERLWSTQEFDPNPHVDDEFTGNCRIAHLESNRDCARAAVEAVDKELGRLLTATATVQGEPDFGQLLVNVEFTTVIVVGDNGSVGSHDGDYYGSPIEPFDRTRAKQTLYEGGINVPLIVSGNGIAVEEGEARVSNALINTSDLLATILELAGVDTDDLPADPSPGSSVPEIDSYSIVPILSDDCMPLCTIESIRKYAFAETNRFDRRGKAVRNLHGYKLILHRGSFSWRVATKDEQGNPVEIEIGNTVENPGQPEDPVWEFYYLGGDPSAPAALTPDEFEVTNLVDPASGQLVAGPAEHLEPILADLRARLGSTEPGTGPVLAAVGKCDVNGDERIDSADLLLATQMARTGTGGASQIARADVAPPSDSEGGDGDGIVDSADILLILRALSGADTGACDHTLI